MYNMFLHVNVTLIAKSKHHSVVIKNRNRIAYQRYLLSLRLIKKIIPKRINKHFYYDQIMCICITGSKSTVNSG